MTVGLLYCRITGWYMFWSEGISRALGWKSFPRYRHVLTLPVCFIPVLLWGQNVFPENSVSCRCCSWGGTRGRLIGANTARAFVLIVVLWLRSGRGWHCSAVGQWHVTRCCGFKPGEVEVWAGQEGEEALCVVAVVIQILSDAKLAAVRFQSFCYVFPMPRTSTNLKLNF